MGKTQTLQIKGIAIVLMLIHHIVLFSPDYINWGHIDILGGFGKICVSIFCFLSGYGLMKSNPDGMEFSTKKFLVKRIISLYSPYWFIWLVFIPWFTLLVNGSFMEAWTANVTPTKTIGWANPIYLLLLDLLGVSKNFGFHNFIGVAWFFGCIIPLYLVFPLIKNTYQNHRLVYWAISVIMMMLWFVARYYSIWIPLIEPFMPYFISFLLGVAMSDDRVMKAGLNKDSGIKPIYLYTIVIVTLVILFLFRLHIHWPYFLTLEWVLIGGGIWLYVNILHGRIPVVGHVFEKLGTHSFNLYLTHTFFIKEYFADKFYSITSSPVLLIVLLILATFSFSILIEGIKKMIGWNNAQKWLIAKLTL